MALTLPISALVLAATVSAQSATSLEECPIGPFTQVTSVMGLLMAAEGHAAIDGTHARAGNRSLRILGGEQRSVELALVGPLREIHEVVFWAERWTRRSPFVFTVEAHGPEGWRAVCDGTEQARVGGGLRSEIRFDVGGVIDRLRFDCTSPPNTGVLIDDLELLVAGPAVLESVSFRGPVLPVLVGNPLNPIARIDFDVRGTEGVLALTEVTVDLAGTTDLAGIREVSLYRGPRALDHRDPRAAFSAEERFGSAQAVGESPLTFHGQLGLGHGETHLWVTVSLAQHPDLDASISVTCPSVLIDETRCQPVDGDVAAQQRLGVALRSRGDDGAEAFRIPGLATTQEGTLIAVYDVRWHGWRDLPGDIDVGLLRSTDGGLTWEPQRIVLDQGGEDRAKWSGDGVGDPAVLVDRETNTIFIVAVWSHGNRGWNGSGPGLDPTETGQLLMVSSRDDGRTWSSPQNLTRETKDPAWSFLLQGPGRGITMHDGTLVFPAQFQASPEDGRTPHAAVLLSADHGETWSVASGARPNTTEAAVVELADGELMLNVRDNRGGARSIYTSLDLGRTWGEHPTSRSALIEPVCMASLIHVGREIDGEPDGRLLFSNPNVQHAPRRRMTIQASDDFGATWRPEKLLLDEGTSAGYSCLTMIDANTIGILYEGSRAHMTFQRIPLRSLFPATGAARADGRAASPRSSPRSGGR